MAAVYKVRHLQLNSFHALKLLFLTAPHVRQRLIREGRVQASLRHPNIVAVTDVLEIEGAPALVMEFVDGPALDEWLVGRKLSIPEALQVFRGIVLGISHAHNLGVAHRDLKPANVLLATTNDGLIPKVTDFGLMKALDPEKGERATTKSGIAMGTPNYMSPEQIRDAASVDRRTDVFALGCILYELLAGQECFPGTNQFEIYRLVTAGNYKPIAELVPDVSRRVSNAIDLCLMTDRDARLSDCDMLFDMLFDIKRVPGGVRPMVTRDEGIQLGSQDSTRRSQSGSVGGQAVAETAPAPAPAALQQKFADIAAKADDAEESWEEARDRGLGSLHTGEQILPAPTRRRETYVSALIAVVFLLLGTVVALVALAFIDPFAVEAPPVVALPTPVHAPTPGAAVEPAEEGDGVADVGEAVATPRVVQPRRKPAAKPTPAPEPAVEEPTVDEPALPVAVVRVEPPVPESPKYATVVVEGDADAVWLSRGASEFHLKPSADVPFGSYAVHAVFGGESAIEAGQIVVETGGKVVLKCSSFAFRCMSGQ